MKTLETEPVPVGEQMLGPQFQLEELGRIEATEISSKESHDIETGRRDVETLQILNGLVDICEVRNEDELDDLVDMVVNGVINHFSPDYRLNETVVSILREKVAGQKEGHQSANPEEAVAASMQPETWQKPTESRWLKPGRVPF